MNDPSKRDIYQLDGGEPDWLTLACVNNTSRLFKCASKDEPKTLLQSPIEGQATWSLGQPESEQG